MHPDPGSLPMAATVRWSRMAWSQLRSSLSKGKNASHHLGLQDHTIGSVRSLGAASTAVLASWSNKQWQEGKWARIDLISVYF